MCSDAVTRTELEAPPRSDVGRRPTLIEYDLVDDVVRALEAYPDDVYWARRLIDLVRDPATASRLRAHIVTAVRRWAAHDPSFFIHERWLSEQLAVWAWPKEILEDLDEQLVLADESLTHFVLGRLWLAARRPPEDMPAFYARALEHLRKVERRLQLGAWHEAMCEALSVAEPDELARSAHEILDTATPSARERAVLAILRGAARAGNWELYDAHRQAYESLGPEAARMDSEIARYDGMRAEHALVHGRDGRPGLSAPRVPRFVQRSLLKTFEAATVRPASRR